MLWLEMSRDPTHGGGSWSFTQCLWSPAHKQRTGDKAAFWETLLAVQAEDSVLHLWGIGQDAAFVGSSTAEGDGFETSERPPEPSQWAYARRFYRVLLRDYAPFPDPIPLRELFSRQDAALRDYFYRNKAKPATQKRRLFYVVQAGRLQCQNGAYLSEVDDELAAILLGPDYSSEEPPTARPTVVSVETGERIRALRTRVGQKTFSDNVRANYNHRCCFPGCSVAERQFLRGAHVARWADVPELRGRVSNGICLCLMHDRALEEGFFTITGDLRVAVHRDKRGAMNSAWCADHVLPYDGEPIRSGAVTISEEALQYHWERIGFRPEG